MKILMLNYEFPPIGGGGGNAHLALLKEFAKNLATEHTEKNKLNADYADYTDLKTSNRYPVTSNKVFIDVLTSGPTPGFFKEQFSDNITIYKVGVHKKNLHLWRRVEIVEWLVKAKLHYRRLIKQTRYDLIHIFFGIPTGLLCVPQPTCPYIVSLRGSDVPGENIRFALDYKLFGPVLKKIWKDAAGLVACSEGLRKRGLRFFSQTKIDVIPNGVELDIFHPAKLAAESKIQNLKSKIITVGRLSVTKRVDLLIDAVELLKKQGREVTLTIVGGGSEIENLKSKIQNLKSKISILGRVPNDKMPDLYREHDVFVSATMQEGMSNAMLEAMASGLPIITTQCEGVEELIKDNGVIVENATAAEIAASIKKVIDNPKTYQQMSKAARAQAERFSWQSVAQAYMQIYQQAVGH